LKNDSPAKWIQLSCHIIFKKRISLKAKRDYRQKENLIIVNLFVSKGFIIWKHNSRYCFHVKCPVIIRGNIINFNNYEQEKFKQKQFKKFFNRKPRTFNGRYLSVGI